MRAWRLLWFLADKNRDKIHFKNLSKTNKFDEFLDALRKQGHSATTMKAYLTDIKLFLQYSLTRELTLTKLKSRIKIKRALSLLGVMMRVISGEVADHRKRVYLKKIESIISPSSLVKYRKYAKTELGNALDEIKKYENLAEMPPALYYAAQGLLTGYLAAVSGHRISALLKITQASLDDADFTVNGSAVIKLSCHKTFQTYGILQLALTSEEFDLFKQFADVVKGINHVNVPDEVFVNFHGKPENRAVTSMRTGWNAAGLEGKPTFKDIQRCITTVIIDYADPDITERLHTAIGHSSVTAKSYYYTKCCDSRMAVENRKCIDKLLIECNECNSDESV